MDWYFQSSPHDTHDWDSTQTAVLFDGEINGQPRKLLAQAARNGYFFVLDRTNGKAIVSTEYVEDQLVARATTRRASRSRTRRRCRRSTARSSRRIRAAPPTGLRRASARRPGCSTSTPARAFSVYYIYDPSDNPQGWGGTDRGGYSESMLQAIDYKTGKIRWSHKWEGGGAVRAAEHGRQSAVQRRTGANFWWRSNATTGDAAVARRLNARRQQRADHLRARRSAVRRRWRGRHAVGVRHEQTVATRDSRSACGPREARSRRARAPGGARLRQGYGSPP